MLHETRAWPYAYTSDSAYTPSHEYFLTSFGSQFDMDATHTPLTPSNPYSSSHDHDLAGIGSHSDANDAVTLPASISDLDLPAPSTTGTAANSGQKRSQRGGKCVKIKRKPMARDTRTASDPPWNNIEACAAQNDAISQDAASASLHRDVSVQAQNGSHTWTSMSDQTK